MNFTASFALSLPHPVPADMEADVAVEQAADAAAALAACPAATLGAGTSASLDTVAAALSAASRTVVAGPSPSSPAWPPPMRSSPPATSPSPARDWTSSPNLYSGLGLLGYPTSTGAFGAASFFGTLSLTDFSWQPPPGFIAPCLPIVDVTWAPPRFVAPSTDSALATAIATIQAVVAASQEC
eukprot:XP_020396972.1 mucin-7-like [Zea mays]